MRSGRLIVLIVLLGVLFVDVAQGELELTESSPLTRAVAKKAGVGEMQAQAQVDRVFAVLKGELLRGHRVVVFGFGTFAVQARRVRARKGSPKDPTPPSRKHIRFRAAESLAHELNRNNPLK